MNALTLRGDRDEAEALAEQIQTEPGKNIVDPWWPCMAGPGPLHQQIMARVRELAR